MNAKRLSLQCFTVTEILKWVILSFYSFGKQFFCNLLAFFISNIVGDTFLSSSVSEISEAASFSYKKHLQSVAKIRFIKVLN